MELTVAVASRQPNFSPAWCRSLVLLASRQVPTIAGQLHVGLVGERRMRTLNRRHRGLDRPTDVLSFAWQEGREPSSVRTLGELYLCPPYLADQARRFKVPVKEEFARMLFHGLLHLVGHDHVAERQADRMFKLQDQLVSAAYRQNLL